MRQVQPRTLKCVMCDAVIELATLDSTHPDAPTLFQPLHPDMVAPWFGFVDGQKLLVLCSEACAQKLLEE